MSRIGKHPVPVPVGVTVEVKGQTVSAKGKLGELCTEIPADVEVSLQDGKVVVLPRSKTQRARMMWGTSRTCVNNLLKGVSEGFRQVLEIEGVGFRAAMQGNDLVLQLGFSHEVRYSAPDGITIKAEKPTVLSVAGADKQKVGQVSAEIRALKKPEPYKGKGIRYAGEWIFRKEGKKK